MSPLEIIVSSARPKGGWPMARVSITHRALNYMPKHSKNIHFTSFNVSAADAKEG